MVIVGAVVAVAHRQPNPNSALGAAKLLAAASPLGAGANGHPVITPRDVANATIFLVPGVFAPGFGLEIGYVDAHLVSVTASTQHACIVVSAVTGVRPYAQARPADTTFNGRFPSWPSQGGVIEVG